MSKRKSKTVATGKGKAGCASVNGSTMSCEYHVEGLDTLDQWRIWYVAECGEKGKVLNPTKSLNAAAGLFKELKAMIAQGNCGWKKARLVRYAVTRTELKS